MTAKQFNKRVKRINEVYDAYCSHAREIWRFHVREARKAGQSALCALINLAEKDIALRTAAIRRWRRMAIARVTREMK